MLRPLRLVVPGRHCSGRYFLWYLADTAQTVTTCGTWTTLLRPLLLVVHGRHCSDLLPLVVHGRHCSDRYHLWYIDDTAQTVTTYGTWTTLLRLLLLVVPGRHCSDRYYLW
ncbi:hypothetical protein DPMN_052023 [Dreissena polymorpha]|uniref:Uncharacterized protein n=1 Tax=Dreissena polymorpha TaxID=45954 RepID=A0A9D4CJP2_DREPO|nr:hypothetical protein DPMN_052023 [Dreissena polymorpha]